MLQSNSHGIDTISSALPLIPRNKVRKFSPQQRVDRFELWQRHERMNYKNIFIILNFIEKVFRVT